jgi:hypothetical protein
MLRTILSAPALLFSMWSATVGSLTIRTRVLLLVSAAIAAVTILAASHFTAEAVKNISRTEQRTYTDHGAAALLTIRPVWLPKSVNSVINVIQIQYPVGARGCAESLGLNENVMQYRFLCRIRVVLARRCLISRSRAGTV